MAGAGIALFELLMRQQVSELRELALRHSIRSSNNTRKAELATRVQNSLVEPGRLRDILSTAEPVCWQFMQNAAASDGAIQVHPKAVRYAMMLAELGYLQYEGDAESGLAEMPAEIKSLFFMICSEWDEQNVRSDLLRTYSQAAVNLYGVISQEELIDIINRQVEEKTNFRELFLSQTRKPEFTDHYCLWENYLVNAGFQVNNFADVPTLLSAIAGKPRYVPEQKVFLRYSDEEYYERTFQTYRLYIALKTGWGISSDQAEKVVSGVVYYIQAGADASAALQILLRQGFALTGNALQILTNMISEIHDTTRQWTNKGYTPQELVQIQAGMKGSSSQQTPEKIRIGRNAPCPCGSGRKYKKCCGR